MAYVWQIKCFIEKRRKERLKLHIMFAVCKAATSKQQNRSSYQWELVMSLFLPLEWLKRNSLLFTNFPYSPSPLHCMRACCPCTVFLTTLSSPSRDSSKNDFGRSFFREQKMAAKYPVMFYSTRCCLYKCFVDRWFQGFGDWVILSNVFWARKCNSF